jgi:hypothetical protein
LKLDKEPQLEEPLFKCITSTEEGNYTKNVEATTLFAEFYSAIAIVQDVTIDDVDNNEHISGPTLVLLRYNLHQQQLHTGLISIIIQLIQT